MKYEKSTGGTTWTRDLSPYGILATILFQGHLDTVCTYEI